MPTIRQVQQLIQEGNYTFSIDHMDVSLHIPVVKHHHCPVYITLYLATQTLSVEGFVLWPGYSP